MASLRKRGDSWRVEISKKWDARSGTFATKLGSRMGGSGTSRNRFATSLNSPVTQALSASGYGGDGCDAGSSA